MEKARGGWEEEGDTRRKEERKRPKLRRSEKDGEIYADQGNHPIHYWTYKKEVWKRNESLTLFCIAFYKDLFLRFALLLNTHTTYVISDKF